MAKITSPGALADIPEHQELNHLRILKNHLDNGMNQLDEESLEREVLNLISEIPDEVLAALPEEWHTKFRRIREQMHVYQCIVYTDYPELNFDEDDLDDALKSWREARKKELDRVVTEIKRIEAAYANQP